ncbi:MAG: ATP-binding cassette subfamily B protein [Maribacter sp.]|jgi:ATP-binding cassette subfamily B protein
MARRRRMGDDDGQPKVKLNKDNMMEVVKTFKYVYPYRWYLIIGLLLLAVSSLVFLGLIAMFTELIKVAEGGDFYGLTLNEMGVGLIFVLILQGVISYFRVTLFAHASEKGTADLRKAVYNKIITLPTTFFEKNQSGELVSRITSDVDRLYSLFSITLVEFIRQVIILFGSVAILLYSNPRLTFIVLGTFPVVVILAIFFGRKLRELSKKRQKAMADTNIILSESIQSIQVVKAFTNELFEMKKYAKTNQSVVTIAIKFARGRGLFSAFIVTILFGALCFVIWQSASMVQAGTLESHDLLGFVMYSGIIGAAIGSLGTFYTEIVGAVGATERIREILEMESEVDVDSKAEKLDLVGDIKYENINFSYPARKDLTIFEDLSFEVNPGQKVALVGQSGSGKSTIVSLLLRFYKIDGGTIKVDGKSIYDYDINRFRKNIAIVPQEVILFGGTIRENILYGKPGASDKEVIAASKKANAWEFIESFPEGMETMIGERGVKLSGGQRQRIAIARAILKNPTLLILDEATSALDAESEKLVQDALNNLMENRTSIIIAHRLATIREVDCIFVIEKGEIVEKGTHDELSVKENGAYSSLAKLQFEPLNN